ncbi:hypothetical protein A988_21252 [Pseudomonas syringae BRIP39023]|uniref:hypothetical protein n=1 Tax=Pseudomonas TaxID=286 RepID=UPI0002A7B94C|nr:MULTISPECIES: hypothetical protein [Pseudomonas]ELQ08634.1 hypothetical protein A988_21252 [Pseudomonas syringae BRIP39023]PBQ16908.1 hypothetical protein CCL09_14480 [Pseudomonas congelans]QVX13921.1 hypothetical protein DB356_03975 [Pseudomonas congelans]
MQSQVIHIPRVTDKTILSFFGKVCELTGVDTVTISTIGFGTLGTEDLSNPSDELKQLLSKNSALIYSVGITIEGLFINYSRNGEDGSPNNAIFSKITLSHDPNSYQRKQLPDIGLILEVVELINKKLKAFSPSIELGNHAAQAKLETLHNSTLERLELLNEELISKTHEYRSALDQEFSEQRSRLDAEHSSKATMLEEIHAQKIAEIADERDSLQKQKQELDDKSNTHARREIRRDILREIKARQSVFTLTEGTNKLRKPIAAGMSLLILFFVTMTISSTWELYRQFQALDPQHLIITTVKQIAFSAGTVGSILFAIRWMNRWFELHMHSEFSLKQFELDMERASWLVETNLEWKEVKGSGMPTELLKPLSKNLFDTQQESVENLVHPADQLASALVGSASAIRLQTGDSMLEIDPKKLAKTKPVHSSAAKN